MIASIKTIFIKGKLPVKTYYINVYCKILERRTCTGLVQNKNLVINLQKHIIVVIRAKFFNKQEK